MRHQRIADAIVNDRMFFGGDITATVPELMERFGLDAEAAYPSGVKVWPQVLRNALNTAVRHGWLHRLGRRGRWMVYG